MRIDPRERYESFKVIIANGGGLTASEWDWFDARMKEWEPDEYARRRKAASVRIALDYFEKHLAPAGYKLVPPEQVP